MAIETGTDDTAYGAVVPDLPGCFAAGGTIDNAVVAAEGAAAAWIDAMLDAGGTIPPPSPIETLHRRRDHAGWAFGVIAVDTAANVTLPRPVLLRLDAQTRAAGESRSGYIAQLTLKKQRA